MFFVKCVNYLIEKKIKHIEVSSAFLLLVKFDNRISNAIGPNDKQNFLNSSPKCVLSSYMNGAHKTSGQNNTVTRNSSLKLF